jgi:hypothetical protein
VSAATAPGGRQARGRTHLIGAHNSLRPLEAARKAKCPVIVSKLDRLSRDVHFISGLMAHRVPFIVTELRQN